MNTRELFIRELRHRPFGFGLGLVAVAAVAACLVGARGILVAHDHETAQLVAGLETRADARMAKLRDEARIFSKSLGFNILLLPPGQDPGRLYTEHRSTHFFTPGQVRALAGAELNTLNHLLPMLRHRIPLESYGGDVILVGIEGEIYIKAPHFQKPIEERIEPGRVHVGDAVRRGLGAEIGDTIELLEERFLVHRLLPQKGNVDDVSLLMNLGDLQRITGQSGKVAGVLALSCNCAAGDMEPIRRELSGVVGDVQVVEFTVRAQARKRARDSIALSTREQMDDLRSGRGAMRSQVARSATILVSLVTVGTVVLLVVLTVTSVRERNTEVAMLRALGLGSGGILALFLYKALATGFAGGALGCLAGGLAGYGLAGAHALAPAPFVGLVLAATVLIAVLATAAPAITASRTDPAVILNQE